MSRAPWTPERVHAHPMLCRGRRLGHGKRAGCGHDVRQVVADGLAAGTLSADGAEHALTCPACGNRFRWKMVPRDQLGG
jgi:hypothetical protein